MTLDQLDFFNNTDTGAEFSQCKNYRYTLWRQWEEGPTCVFCMLNPSTADEVTNDPSVERCERRARQWGYSRLVVVNLFAWRATNPEDMKASSDPVGFENDRLILEIADKASLFVCAWGNHGSYLERSAYVTNMLRSQGVSLHYLMMTSSGEPQHPLYLPYDMSPTLWTE
jgi:hypothetical protein